MVQLRRPDGSVLLLALDSTTEVGRFDVGEKFSHISRCQATVLVTERNVVVVSHGSNPTGVRHGASAPWRWLKKEQEATVGHSAQICLDRKEHSSVNALLTLDPEATSDTEAAPPAPATEAAPPPPSDEAAAAAPAPVPPAPTRPPATPTRAGGPATLISRPVQWLWQSSVSRDEWRLFLPSQGDAIESGWAAGQERVPLDAERYVDLRAMKQCRTDDPTRSRRVRRDPPVPDDSPAHKRQHTEQAAPSTGAAREQAAPSHQPSLPSPPAAMVAPLASIPPPAAAPAALVAPAPAATAAAAASTPTAAAGGDDDLVPREVPPPSDASWSASRAPSDEPAKFSLLVRCAHEAPRSCAAVFDMDGTLLRWMNGVRGPSKLADYALWSGRVAALLQALHADGHKLVIMSNQGGIKGALEGKNATRVKQVVDWLALRCGVPLHGLFATKHNEYRKPAPGMWAVMEQALRRHT